MSKGLVLILAATVLASRGQSPRAAPPRLEFDYARVAGPLGTLTGSDRKTVEDTVTLMKQGDHKLALVRLSALNGRHPSNSSLRLLSSYALLQLGNLAESLAEAQRAHDAEGHGVYQCYILAHVAAINGNKELTQREIGHVNSTTDGEMKNGVAALAGRVSAN